MINNTELLLPYIDFPSEDTFYFLQVIKRRKDGNPELTNNCKTVKSYFIYVETDLNVLFDKVYKTCIENNARAYLRLNKRSSKQCALQTMVRLSTCIASENYRHIQGIFDSIAGEYHSDPQKKWIIDLDADTLGMEQSILDWRFKNNPNQDEKQIEVLLRVPTVSGVHLITNPFRLDHFNKQFTLDVKKDNPTLLFYQPK